MNKITGYKMVVVAAFVVLGVAVSAHVASAQSVYTGANGTQYSVPAGYSVYGTGTYYNSSTGMYFNPVTGQTSNVTPSGPAAMSGGVYTIPAGYDASLYGTYYNQSTGTWYDPATGFMSTSAPLGPNASAGGTVTTPTLPDTGAGGDAAMNLAILASTLLVAIGGVAFLSKKTALSR